MGHEDTENSAALTLAEEAATIAAKRVAKIHRKRAVTQAFLAGVLAVLLVVAPAAYFIDRERRTAALERARFNCDQQTKAVTVQESILQIGNDLRRDLQALNRSENVKRELERVFGSALITDLFAKQAILERDALSRWNLALQDLRHLARLDCNAVLQPSGVKTTPNQPPLNTNTTR